ncbi:unnamed protein product [Paramecium primaurelia]|uniref:Uncharacterized protein n=1 Tax=Paramecium primaurelia TaxID=5886 RepID=A0A8S1JWJ5_PARPR|nr:unnamed protein product [Paramecium primaurelia]
MSQCPIEHHDQQKIKYICIDPKCTHEQKLGCADCFLENHISQAPQSHSHTRVQISKFEEDLNSKILNVRNLQIEPIANDSSQFDEDFNICLNQVASKLNNFKDELKKEMNNDVLNFDDHVNEFKNTIQNQIDPILPCQNSTVLTCTPEELAKAISFYQDSDQLSSVLQKQIDQIENHREKVQQNKQKITTKLQNVVDQMLRQLDQYQIKNSNGEIQGTPEKANVSQTAIFLSASSTTQSPPIKTIIDAARSRKSIFPQTQQQQQQQQQKKGIRNKN